LKERGISRNNKSWGSGTKRIIDLCKEQNLPEPDYKEEQGGFSVWFYKDIYTEENLRKMRLNEWKAFLKKGDIKNAPEKLAITAKEIEKFLIKPREAVNKVQEFDGEWKAPGPWN